MRYDIEGLGICFLHPKHADNFIVSPRWVWHVEYPNGWVRRSTANKDGQVIYTRWIKPEEK